MIEWLRRLFKRERPTVVYPFKPMIAALKAKDAKLYARLCHLQPSAFARAWREKYPEDFVDKSSHPQ